MNNLRIRLWVFPMFSVPFPYEIVEPNGQQYLPDLPVEDDLVPDGKKAARMLDLEFMVKYIGEPVDVYVQGIKQPDTKLTRVEKVNGLWEFETE